MKIVIFEKRHVTLTLTSDDLESHVVMNVSSTLTNTTIWFVAALSLNVDGWTYLLGLLGHLSIDDLKLVSLAVWFASAVTNQHRHTHHSMSHPPWSKVAVSLLSTRFA